MNLGDPGYRELWAFAHLRGREYATARLTPGGELEDVWVHGLAIVDQRFKGGESGGFLLLELDADGGVIDDWVESGLEEAKLHGAARADMEAEGLPWEPVPDADDVAKYIRARLRD
jgi:hypothetical protein